MVVTALQHFCGRFSVATFGIEFKYASYAIRDETVRFLNTKLIQFTNLSFIIHENGLGLHSKMHEISWRSGSAPNPAGEVYDTPQTPGRLPYRAFSSKQLGPQQKVEKI